MRDERLFPLYAPLDSLPGIGPKLKLAFERLLGGDTVWDLLLHLPERWLDRRLRDTFEETEFGEVATISGEVQKHQPGFTATAPHRVRLVDETGFLTLVYFRADPRWLQRQFPVGEKRVVSGRIDDFNGERQIVHPDHVCNPDKDDLPPPVEPIYSLTAGLTNKRVHQSAIAGLEKIPDDLPEWSDSHLIEARRWPSMKDALLNLHAPANYDDDVAFLAKERLAYDEALAREHAFALSQAARRTRAAPALQTDFKAQDKLVRSLPYRPTGAQMQAVKEIADDLTKTYPMRRMLQGDVGAGKTLVGVLAAIQAAEAGFQTAFMAPTEVLARQQFSTLETLLHPLGYNVEALTGRDKGKKRETLLEGLETGSIQVVAGTQALIQEGVSFNQLGLVIVDEQHRFGVMDRAKLASKGLSPHILVMSATPIPRTLALAVHGDLDTSILDEKPIGRQPVKTSAIPDARIEDVVDAVGRATQRGEQAFWVCPRVDVDDEDGSSAIARHSALTDQLRVPVALVHGRMKPAEKDAALEAFRSGKARVLVATTVIEVGVDVPNATIMVIERAEGFGLAQLHQLRGRVGRGSKQAFCLLLFRAPLGDIAKARLDTLRQTEDGFKIAEADFRLRGPGDMLGLRQSGAPTFRVLQVAEHGDLFEIARQDRAMITAREGNTSDPEREKALAILRELFGPKLPKPTD
ncbi:MAG: ATP-dependent DNA helicase RecG [Pseudomonadota bacterium]